VAAGASTIRNNIVVGNISSNFASGPTCANAKTVSSNNLSTAGTESGCGVTNSFSTADFLSTDPSSPDFLKLKATSTAIDQGYNLSAVFTTDYAGTVRDANFDIGAFEYSTSQIDTTPPNIPSGLSVE
jgi:hypothetical protein